MPIMFEDFDVRIKSTRDYEKYSSGMCVAPSIPFLTFTHFHFVFLSLNYFLPLLTFPIIHFANVNICRREIS